MKRALVLTLIALAVATLAVLFAKTTRHAAPSPAPVASKPAAAVPVAKENATIPQPFVTTVAPAVSGSPVMRVKSASAKRQRRPRRVRTQVANVYRGFVR